MKGLDQRIYLNQADLGHAFGGWFELQGNGRTDAAPAAASIEGMDGMPYVNQAEYRHAFSGWFSMSADSP